MAIVSARIIVLLVIAGFSICVESLPDGCTKVIGSPKDGLPGEFFVRVHPTVKPETVVTIMLELTNSNCKGRLWRSSNTSNAIMKPITSSRMYYMQGFGFFAKMSDAAVIWLCEKDVVDYIEPNYPPPVTTDDSTPTKATTTTTTTDDSNSTGSPVVLKLTSEAPSTNTTCTKLRGGDLLLVNNYLIMLQSNSLALNNDSLYALMNDVMDVDSNFNISEIKPVEHGLMKGFYYHGLSKDAVMMLCESDLVDYIEVLKETNESTPQPTPSPTPGKCNKLKKYKDEMETTIYRYIVTFTTNTSSSFMQLFIDDLKAQTNRPANTMKVQNLQLLLYMKMFTVEMNKEAMEHVCENPKVKSIEYETEINSPPTASTTATPNTTTEAPTTQTCNKIRGGKPIKTKGSNLCKIYMTIGNTKADSRKFLRRMTAMDADSNSGIQFVLKEVSHDSEPPMFVARVNLLAINTVCQSEDINTITRI